jgi:predicted RNA binding protein YcfA (HicA-like mRNA interferase family)
MNSRDIIRAIERDGWRRVRVTGDHFHFRHPDKPGLVTVPHPRRDVAPGTLRSMERKAVCD